MRVNDRRDPTQTTGPAASARPALNLLATASLLALAACGGGGGEVQLAAPAAPAASAAPPVVAAAVPVVLAGVAATGAPVAKGEVNVKDALGTAVCDTTTDDQGSYQCTLSTSAKAPFVVAVRKDEVSLYSTTASAVSATVNLTPLTTLIVARLTPSGDPAKFADAVMADPQIATAAKIDGKVSEIKAMIAPLLSAVGDTINPISGSFKADGQGHDKVLDALQISIRPEGQSSNIELTVKTRPESDSSSPLQLAFKSSDSQPAVITKAIDADRLIDNDVAFQVGGLMGRLTGCYAKPLDKRVANVVAGASSAVGTAADVIAQECKGLFVDGDPAKYFENGFVVSSSGHFSGLFKDSATGAKFDKGNFEYLWANGDAYVTYRSTASDGTVATHASTVRRVGGKLVIVGNQYRYDASVRPYATDREVLLQPEYNWFGTGYNVSIRNVLDAKGLPLFKEVVATDPNGRQVTYRPLAGRTTMLVVRPDGTQSPHQIQFLASAYQDRSRSDSPQLKDPVFLVEPALNDDQIRAIPDQGVWTLEWTHVDSSQANVKQHFRTISRAPTIAEIRLQPFVQLTSDFRTEFLADGTVAAARAVVFGAPSASSANVASFATKAGAAAWAVADGALAPSSLSVFGRAVDQQSFNDALSLASTARSGTVGCVKKGSSDQHCDSSTGVTQFAQGSYINYFTLWARNGRQVEFDKNVILYGMLP